MTMLWARSSSASFQASERSGWYACVTHEFAAQRHSSTHLAATRPVRGQLAWETCARSVQDAERGIRGNLIMSHLACVRYISQPVLLLLACLQGHNTWSYLVTLSISGLQAVLRLRPPRARLALPLGGGGPRRRRTYGAVETSPAPCPGPPEVDRRFGPSKSRIRFSECVPTTRPRRGRSPAEVAKAVRKAVDTRGPHC